MSTSVDCHFVASAPTSVQCSLEGWEGALALEGQDMSERWSHHNDLKQIVIYEFRTKRIKTTRK